MKPWDEYLDLVEKHPTLFAQEELEIVLDNEIVDEFERTHQRRIGIAYKSDYRYMLADLVRFPNGNLGVYERVVPVNTGAAAVLPMYHGKIALIKTFRHPTRQWHWEIPRGFGDGISIAKKKAFDELFEETGLDPESISLEPLGKIHPDSGLTSDLVDVFLAKVKDFDVTLDNKEDTESIEKVQLFTKNEINQMIAKGEITDGFTLSAITMYGAWLASRD